MRAGQVEGLSVRPFNIAAQEVKEEEVESEGESEAEGVKGVRLRLPEENEFVRKLRDPRLPTPEEVEEHNIRGHIPYRDWCPICVQAKGRGQYHYKDKGAAWVLPEYAWDYCFPGDELGFKWTVLVGTEKGADMAMATAVPVKGGKNEFISDKCMDFIRENGIKKGRLSLRLIRKIA